LASAVDGALALPALEATRRRKGKEVVEDIRPVIRRLDVHGSTCTMELHTQPRSAKPGDVLAAITSASAIEGGLAEAHVLRTHQWIERDGARHEPLRADTRPRTDELSVRVDDKGTTDVQREHDAGALAGVSGSRTRSGEPRDE
jgi:hypothetical protein